MDQYLKVDQWKKKSSCHAKLHENHQVFIGFHANQQQKINDNHQIFDDSGG